MSNIVSRIAIIAAAVCGFFAFSAQAEKDAGEHPRNFTLSDWGREVVLPELTPAAPAALRADESQLPDFGQFLADEARTFGAGALDAAQLRRLAADRALGRDNDAVRAWMASRWQSAPGRFAGFLTDYAEARLAAMPGVESADIRWSPRDDDAFGAFSASGVAALRPDEFQAFGFQPKIERFQSDGRLLGSFGLFHRRALGDSAVAGVNMFTQHMDDPARGSFSRWWVGADFASPWVEADVKRYVGDDGREFRRNGRRFWAYAPDGLSAELRVHSPNLRWLEGYAQFSEWNGRGGNPDTRDHSFGLTFQPHYGPLTGLRTNAEFAANNAVNVDLSYNWVFGQGAPRPGNADPFAVYSEIADPVNNPSDFNIHEFELYEASHLFESIDKLGPPEIGLPELYRRISLSWELVEPEYMRIDEELRPHCPVPQYISLYQPSPTLTAETGTSFLWQFSTLGLCNILNGDHTAPFGWWLNEDAYDEFRGVIEEASNPLAGSLLFIMAAERLDVNAVKLLLIAGANPDDQGLFSASTSLDRKPYAGDSRFAGWFRPEEERLRALEGVGKRIALSELLDEDDEVIERAKEIARILKANGASCRPEQNTAFTEDACNIALSADYDDPFERVEVPKGSLPESAAAYVPLEYSGEAFRVTADTDYADVEYSLTLDDAFAAVRSNFSLTVDGTYRMYYDPYWRWDASTGNYYRETKEDLTGDSRIAVINMTGGVPVGEYGLTLVGDFFVHRNKLNKATLHLAVHVFDPPSDQVVLVPDDYGTGAGGAGLEFAHPDIPELTFQKVGSNAVVDVVNGRLRLNSELLPSESSTVTVRATSPHLRGELEFVVVVLNPDLDDPRGLTQLNIAEGCLKDDATPISSAESSKLKSAVRNRSSLTSDRDKAITACAAIRAGADVNLAGTYPLLYYAIQQGNIYMYRALLANGANHEFQTNSRGDEVHVAAEYAETTIARFFARKGLSFNDLASIRYGRDRVELAPIHILAQRTRTSGNSIEFLLMLVSIDSIIANLNIKNGNGDTFLHMIVKKPPTSSYPILDALLTAPTSRLNPNVLSDSGKLPFAWSVELGRVVVMEKLGQYSGTDLDAKESNGYAAIHYAVDEDTFIWLTEETHADIDYEALTGDAGDTGRMTLLDILSDNYDGREDFVFSLYDDYFLRCAVFTYRPVCLGEYIEG